MDKSAPQSINESIMIQDDEDIVVNVHSNENKEANKMDKTAEIIQQSINEIGVNQDKHIVSSVFSTGMKKQIREMNLL